MAQQRTESGVVRIGHTEGLVSTARRETCEAEQVYVRLASGPHPIAVDAWNGYDSVGLMRLTRKQAGELIGLLAQALEHAPVET